MLTILEVLLHLMVLSNIQGSFLCHKEGFLNDSQCHIIHFQSHRRYLFHKLLKAGSMRFYLLLYIKIKIKCVESK